MVVSTSTSHGRNYVDSLYTSCMYVEFDALSYNALGIFFNYFDALSYNALGIFFNYFDTLSYHADGIFSIAISKITLLLAFTCDGERLCHVKRIWFFTSYKVIISCIYSYIYSN